MATSRIIGLGAEFFNKSKGKPPAPPPDREDDAVPGDLDDEGTGGGSSLKPKVLAAWHAWVNGHKGQNPPKGLEWAMPASEKETAHEFAMRAAEKLREEPEAEEAVDAVGDGPDFEDWVLAVMRYEGEEEASQSAGETAEKSLSGMLMEAVLAQAGDMAKSAGASLSATEAGEILKSRYLDKGAQFAKCEAQRATGVAAIVNGVPFGPQGQSGIDCCCGGHWQDARRTLDEYAEQAGKDAMQDLLWQQQGDKPSPVLLVVRKIGGPEKYAAQIREWIMEGARAAKKKQDRGQGDVIQ
jgi:hypothetical protein